MHLDASGLKLVEYRGGLALIGPSLNAAFDHFNCDTPPSHPHITLLTAAERNATTAIPDIPTSHVYVLGPSGKDGGWLVVLWNHGDVFRSSLGLARKAYHVTLSENQADHSLDKSLDAALRSGLGLRLEIDLLDAIGLDHAIVAASGHWKTQLAERLIISHPECYRGYARLAEATDIPALSAACYARAVSLYPPLLSVAARALTRLRDVPYGMLSDIANPVGVHLVQPWPLELGDALSHLLWTGPVEKRIRVPLPSTTLPRFFSWLYPARLGECQLPVTRMTSTPSSPLA
ncbi:hypothetical protein CspHIS471_0608850 [Cutaneotrichosporon sp. HIS471]|nr:hypothetical protein CspHIS471_0608850 [Cutaneotrichosporon sp. HIS471]